MLKLISLLLAVFLLSGCVAIVDESAQGRKVKSFLITNDETVDLIDRINETPEEEKTVIYKR